MFADVEYSYEFDQTRHRLEKRVNKISLNKLMEGIY